MAEISTAMREVAEGAADPSELSRDSSPASQGSHGASPVPGEGAPVGEGAAEGGAGSDGALAPRENAKQRKKDDRSIEHILRALASLATPEEKLAALCKKYADLHEEQRLQVLACKTHQKRLATVMREKDQLQTDHSKSVLAKSKLESLCRELQRHNKLVKEESLARQRDEEEKRKDVTTKFQTTISEIQVQMNDHNTQNTKLRQENLELATKLQGLIEQYDTQAQHYEKVVKHRALEGQLLEARLQQSQLQLQDEREKHEAEQGKLVAERSATAERLTLLVAQETQLRQQVAFYAEKYEDFQATFAKSNDVFQTFRQEMDKMTKKMKKLEKETLQWKSRWEGVTEEKKQSDKQLEAAKSKADKLERLCRALQHRAAGTEATAPPADHPSPDDVATSAPCDAAASSGNDAIASSENAPACDAVASSFRVTIEPPTREGDIASSAGDAVASNPDCDATRASDEGAVGPARNDVIPNLYGVIRPYVADDIASYVCDVVASYLDVACICDEIPGYDATASVAVTGVTTSLAVHDDVGTQSGGVTASIGDASCERAGCGDSGGPCEPEAEAPAEPRGMALPPPLGECSTPPLDEGFTPPLSMDSTPPRVEVVSPPLCEGSTPPLSEGCALPLCEGFPLALSEGSAPPLPTQPHSSDEVRENIGSSTENLDQSNAAESVQSEAGICADSGLSEVGISGESDQSEVSVSEVQLAL